RSWSLGLSLSPDLSHGCRHVPGSTREPVNPNRFAIAGAVLAVTLPLACRSAAPAADARPGMTDQQMSALMGMDDAAPLGKLMIDQLEAEGGSGGSAPTWDAQAWYGGDYDKVWFK